MSSKRPTGSGQGEAAGTPTHGKHQSEAGEILYQATQSLPAHL